MGIKVEWFDKDAGRWWPSTTKYFKEERRAREHMKRVQNEWGKRQVRLRDVGKRKLSPFLFGFVITLQAFWIISLVVGL